jgi:hypothetical protein
LRLVPASHAGWQKKTRNRYRPISGLPSISLVRGAMGSALPDWLIPTVSSGRRAFGPCDPAGCGCAKQVSSDDQFLVWLFQRGACAGGTDKIGSRR